MSFSLSIVVLNWNRVALLEQCIESLLATTPAFDTCILIDNNSTDRSPDLIRAWTQRDSRFEAMLQPENRGAEWINDAVARIHSDFIYILANDKLLLPGWFDYTRRVFDAFPEVGQLALHAPAPLDNEVWVTKPARFAWRDGVGVFLADGNTGMSTILRASVIARGRIRFMNHDRVPDIHLPNDRQLSEDIRALGYRSAWSERYYCLNVGHTIEEFSRDPQYYDANYESKPPLKREGLASRIEAFRRMPKPARTGRIFGWAGEPEPTNAGLSVPERIWSMVEGGSPELEALEFMYAICRLIKPEHVLVIRGGAGFVPAAVGRALQDNDRGSVRYVEPHPRFQESCDCLLSAEGLAETARRIEAEADARADLLIVAGYFEEQDWDWLKPLMRSHAANAQYVLLQKSALPAGLDSVFEDSRCLRMEFPTPRQLTLLQRR